MRKALTVFAVLSISMMLLALPLTVRGATPQLYINPALVQKHPADLGTDFTVDIVVNGVNDLYAFVIRITWDNTLITFVSLDNTPLHIIWPDGFFEPLPGYQTGAGYFRYDALYTPNTPGSPGFTGTGTMFTLKFHVASATPGQTSIQFDLQVLYNKLSDSGGNPITHTTTDGTYQMLSTLAPVGGEWSPITFQMLNPMNMLQLLAPWLGLVSLMVLAAALLGSIKRRIK